jgi:hypothetical protein
MTRRTELATLALEHVLKACGDDLSTENILNTVTVHLIGTIVKCTVTVIRNHVTVIIPLGEGPKAQGFRIRVTVHLTDGPDILPHGPPYLYRDSGSRGRQLSSPHSCDPLG